MLDKLQYECGQIQDTQVTQQTKGRKEKSESLHIKKIMVVPGEGIITKNGNQTVLVSSSTMQGEF